MKTHLAHIYNPIAAENEVKRFRNGTNLLPFGWVGRTGGFGPTRASLVQAIEDQDGDRAAGLYFDLLEETLRETVDEGYATTRSAAIENDLGRLTSDMPWVAARWVAFVSTPDPTPETATFYTVRADAHPAVEHHLGGWPAVAGLEHLGGLTYLEISPAEALTLCSHGIGTSPVTEAEVARTRLVVARAILEDQAEPSAVSHSLRAMTLSESEAYLLMGQYQNAHRLIARAAGLAS